MIKTNTIILIALLAIGLLFRLLWLDKQSFWLDEGYTASISNAIAVRGYPQLDSGLLFYKQNIAHHYLVALPVKVFGTNPWTIRIVSVIFGSASIYLLYLLTKKLFGKASIALLSSGFLAFAHWAIVWSRQGRSYAMFQFLYLASIYCLLLLLEKFNLKRFLSFVGLSLIAILTHDTGIIILPFGLLILTWHYRHDLKIYWQKYTFKIIIFSILPLIAFSYLIFTKALIFINLYSSKIFFVADDYIKYLLQNYSFLFIASLIGLYIFYKKAVNKSFALTLTLFYIIALIVTVFATDYIEFRYIFYLFPLMIGLAIYALVESSKFMKDNIFKWGLMIIILVLTNWSNLDFQPKKVYALDVLLPNPNFNQAYKIIKNDLKPTDLIISPYTPLDMAYLGRSDYWLMISFSGKPAELENFKNFPYDLYHKKPVVRNENELAKIMASSHGYIIIDDLSSARLGYNFTKYIDSHSKNIFTEIKEPNSSIWVYKF